MPGRTRVAPVTIHLIKLSVGTESILSLSAWQTSYAKRLEKAGRGKYPIHTTRMSPRRRDEILAGGSIYWVIKGMVQARQRIRDLVEIKDHDGRKACEIVLDPELIPTLPQPRRAFQGWRYLEPDDAPDDLGEVDGAADLPPKLRVKLLDIGAW